MTDIRKTGIVITILIVTLVSLAASADGLVVAEGETFFVFPGEQIFFGPVKVDGIFQNDGHAISTSVFTNNSIVRNDSFFENRGEFINNASVENTGIFINYDRFTNEFGSLLTSSGGFYDEPTASFENDGRALFAEIDIRGRFDNYGDLTTYQGGPVDGSDGIHGIGGVLDNYDLWDNSGVVHVGTFTTAAEVGNAGLLFNTGDMLVAGGSRLINAGKVDNRGILLVEGELINDGLINNTGELILENLLSPGAASISGTGEIVNDGHMQVNVNAATVAGRWTNQQTMDFRTDHLVVEGQLINEDRLTALADTIEIAEGGRLEQSGFFAMLDGALTNHGVTDVNIGSLSATSVENSGNLNIALGGQLAAQTLVQQAGHTQVDGLLAAQSIDLFGGSFAGINGQISGQFGSQTVNVSVWGGTISGGTRGLDINGNLTLYDDATLFATVGEDATRIDVTGDLMLGGTLEIEFTDGYAVSPGDMWRLATATNIDGAFDDIILPQISGIAFDLFIAGPFESWLMLGAVQAVPIPAPVILLFGACIVLARFRRTTAS